MPSFRSGSPAFCRGSGAVQGKLTVAHLTPTALPLQSHQVIGAFLQRHPACEVAMSAVKPSSVVALPPRAQRGAGPARAISPSSKDVPTAQVEFPLPTLAS